MGFGRRRVRVKAGGLRAGTADELRGARPRCQGGQCPTDTSWCPVRLTQNMGITGDMCQERLGHRQGTAGDQGRPPAWDGTGRSEPHAGWCADAPAARREAPPSSACTDHQRPSCQAEDRRVWAAHTGAGCLEQLGRGQNARRPGASRQFTKQGRAPALAVATRAGRVCLEAGPALTGRVSSGGNRCGAGGADAAGIGQGALGGPCRQEAAASPRGPHHLPSRRVPGLQRGGRRPPPPTLPLTSGHKDWAGESSCSPSSPNARPRPDRPGARHSVPPPAPDLPGRAGAACGSADWL